MQGLVRLLKSIASEIKLAVLPASPVDVSINM